MLHVVHMRLLLFNYFFENMGGGDGLDRAQVGLIYTTPFRHTRRPHTIHNYAQFCVVVPQGLREKIAEQQQEQEKLAREKAKQLAALSAPPAPSGGAKAGKGAKVKGAARTRTRTRTRTPDAWRDFTHDYRH